MEKFSDSGLVRSAFGSTVLVAGNGPSLSCYDREFYESFPVSIGVNSIAEFFRPSIIYNIECPPFRWNHVKTPADMGIPWVTSSDQKNSTDADWYVDLDKSQRGEFPENRNCYDNRGACSHTSAFGALHLAYVLGASRIYLIGVDFCAGEDGRQYPGRRIEASGDRWYLDPKNNHYIKNLSWFSLAFATLRDNNVKTYDLSPYGKLRDIEKVSAGDVVLSGTSLQIDRIKPSVGTMNSKRIQDTESTTTENDPIQGISEPHSAKSEIQKIQEIPSDAVKVEDISSVTNNTAVILGPGPGSCMVDVNRLYNIGPVISVNGAFALGAPDYALISKPAILHEYPDLAEMIDEYGKDGGYVIAPKKINLEKFPNGKKYGGFLHFCDTASLKAQHKDPKRGFHAASGAGTLAMQIAEWLGFRKAVLIGFDFELFSGGKKSLLDEKAVAASSRQAITDMLQAKANSLIKYLQYSKLEIYTPYWSHIDGTRKLGMKPNKKRNPCTIEMRYIGEKKKKRELVKTRRPMTTIYHPKKRKIPDKIIRDGIGHKRIALFPPARQCAVQDAFDGIKNGLEKNNIEATMYEDRRGIKAHAEEMGKYDLAIICPQTDMQKYDMDDPSKKIFDQVHAKGCATCMLLPDEPYESGWYDRVAKRATVRLTNEESRLQYYQDAFYYPLTANSAVHIPKPIQEKHYSDICFIGGADERAFKRRRDYFAALKDMLDRPENIFIGVDMRQFGYEKARFITHKIPNSEAVRYYCGAKINLNIHRDDYAYSNNDSFFNRTRDRATHINPRTFEIIGCGAFQLVDNSRSEINRFFPDIPVFDSPKALRVLIERYLNDRQERKRIVNACRKYYHEDILKPLLPKIWAKISSVHTGRYEIVAGPFRDKETLERFRAHIPESASHAVLCVEKGIAKNAKDGETLVTVDKECPKGIAWNDGFKKTSTGLVLFCPGDVVLNDHACQILAKEMTNEKAFTIGYGHRWLGNRLVYACEFDPEWLQRINYIGEVFMIRSDRMRPFTDLRRFAEWEWLCKGVQKGEIGLNINQVLAKVERNMDSDYKSMTFDEAHKLLRKERSGMPRIKFQ